MIRRGEIWWAELPSPEGSSPGFSRPVLIIQDDRFNSSRISTIVVAVITSNLRLGMAPGNVLLDSERSGLPRDSIVNVSQILAIDKLLLTEMVGTIPSDDLTLVENGPRLVTGL